MTKKINLRMLGLIIVSLNSLIFLSFVFYSILIKEEIRSAGQLGLLPLRPQDPRSLLQGDYMILRYDWSLFDSSKAGNQLRRGYLLFEIEDGIIRPIRLDDQAAEKSSGMYSIKFYRSDYEIKIGAESFFFQEGTSGVYSSARYAGIKFLPNSKTGDKLLVGLYDENKKLLLPTKD
ncbi:MAG: GDYXXLXY domain-containing protein [Leptospiraceae bacterium]|nr:GDYXXLXY domain-containing protein [Leptospiraceae bacterium]